MSAWQPIATAPRDGKPVIVMRDYWPGNKSGRAEKCNSHNTYVAAWWSGERNGSGAWICFMDSIRDPVCPIEPTHWMELPAPPVSDKHNESSPDDLRAMGWAVAVHNDYRLNGENHTFWLFTRGSEALKGEGRTDAEALNAARSELARRAVSV